MTTDKTRRPGAGARRSLVLTAVAVLGLGAALGACEPSRAGTEAAAVMPDVRCLDLQAAQDRTQEAGIPKSSSRDASGRDREQLWDRNWVVVDQTPAPGAAVVGVEVVFSVVKDDEPNNCTTTATVAPTTATPATVSVPTLTTAVPAPTTTVAPPLPTAAPTKPTTARPAPAPPAVAPTCANGTYVNADGNAVCRPQSGPVAPSGATARCKDGSWSFSQNRRGTCSGHGGVAEWL